MTVLDDLTAQRSMDPGGMAELICRFPSMMKESLDLVSSVSLSPDIRPGGVIFCGMGGSAISADIASRLAERMFDVPAIVVRGYDLPKFAGKDSLVFILSYSGNTEETLSCYEEALSSGAKIIAVTSGGKLAERSIEKGHAIFKIPAGLPPRASMPYLLVPILYVLDRIFPGTDLLGQIGESVGVLEEIKDMLKPEIPLSANMAKQTAAAMIGKLPFIFGSEGGSDAAAYRWKCQISENSKMNACFNVFPEMDHNELVNLAGAGSKDVFAVFLRDERESGRMKKRIDVTENIIRGSISGAAKIYSKGISHLSRILSLCYFGDFVSIYLAFLAGVDPMPVKAIEKLKKELAA